MVFKPLLMKSYPEEFKTIKLTFDEFLGYSPDLKLERFNSHGSCPQTCSILEAAKSMRSKKQLNCGYSFSISADKNLDRIFQLPKLVEEEDLFTRFWPIPQTSRYLRLRSKLLCAFQQSYHSAPYSAYAGMSCWYHIMSGKIEIVLIEPTDTNLARYAMWEQLTPFIPQSETSTTHVLRQGNFILAPPGCIIIIRALKDTFCLAGEYLSQANLEEQLDCLSRNVIDSNGRYTYDRDYEIRTMYWIFVARILDDHKSILTSYDKQTLSTLKDHLLEWESSDNYLKKKSLLSYYGPTGMRLDLIRRDLASYVNHHSKKPNRGALKTADK